jgi:acetate kinase
MEPREVQSLLYEESGLLGVSGISSDMRELHSSDDPRAREAIDLFTWRAAREAGALVSSLGGLDGFVFTAGIGENDAKVRAAIAKRLEWTSLRIDDHANRSPSQVISTPESGVKVLVVSTDEEHMIALHTFEALSGIVLAPKSIGRSSDGRST